jgi:aminoglycoside phosphotransferase (APT) family kinase protein
MDNYLGTLPRNDPLYDILAFRAFPGIMDPIFHVSRMHRNTVFKYTEERTGISLVGKFYNTESTPEQSSGIHREYDNLKAMRARGLNSSPHYVVRPISREQRIGLALIEEFIDGNDLDHYLKRAVYHGDGIFLRERLADLARFLYVLHRTTLRSEKVELAPQDQYFQKILEVLCADHIVLPGDREKYLALKDIWLGRDILRDPNMGIVHGDPTPTNFIFTGSGDVVAIDLERMKEADAVFDIGMVCAEIKHAFLWRTGNRYASEPYIRQFFENYSSHFSDPHITFRDITRRNPFYMALSELRIARNKYLDVGYRKKLAREALECLECGLAIS